MARKQPLYSSTDGDEDDDDYHEYCDIDDGALPPPGQGFQFVQGKSSSTPADEITTVVPPRSGAVVAAMDSDVDGYVVPGVLRKMHAPQAVNTAPPTLAPRRSIQLEGLEHTYSSTEDSGPKIDRMKKPTIRHRSVPALNVAALPHRSSPEQTEDDKHDYEEPIPLADRARPGTPPRSTRSTIRLPPSTAPPAPSIIPRVPSTSPAASSKSSDVAVLQQELSSLTLPAKRSSVTSLLKQFDSSTESPPIPARAKTPDRLSSNTQPPPIVENRSATLAPRHTSPSVAPPASFTPEPVSQRRWFYAGSLDQLRNVLMAPHSKDGAFAVQASQRRIGQYTLTVRIQQDLATLPINYDPEKKMYQLGTFDWFPSVDDIVSYYGSNAFLCSNKGWGLLKFPIADVMSS